MVSVFYLIIIYLLRIILHRSAHSLCSLTHSLRDATMCTSQLSMYCRLCTWIRHLSSTCQCVSWPSTTMKIGAGHLAGCYSLLETHVTLLHANMLLFFTRGGIIRLLLVKQSCWLLHLFSPRYLYTGTTHPLTCWPSGLYYVLPNKG